MTSRRAEHQPDTLAEQFSELCHEQQTFPDVQQFLQEAQVTEARAQLQVLLVDQAARIERGLFKRAEDYLNQFPKVAVNLALCLELVSAEYALRTQQGESISRAGFLARFPQWRDHLSQIIEPDTAASLDATIDVPLDFAQSLPAETINVSPADSIEDLSQETLAIPRELLPGFGDDETGQPATTMKGDQTSPDASEDTLYIDSQSLSKMMQGLSQEDLHSSGPETQAIGPQRGARSNSTDTLFVEGVAYDKNQPRREFGDYDLLGEIARGGMGVVFKARQRKLKRIVALKMILSGTLAGSEDVRRFYAEAESAAALDHPHIVPIYEVGEYRGQHFFSMGYIEGESLADKVASNPMPAKAAAAMMAMIAEAVEYAHQHGVIHRDLKPANVLLDAQENPKITDFGLAKQTESEHDLTSPGQIMGTPNYMSPEQATGDILHVGPCSDIYALGAMLYCLVTGRPPFQAPSVLELLQQVKNDEPISPKRLAPSLPVDLETICLKCLAKEPDRRYESAQALADDLNRFLKGIPVLAHPVGRAERLWRWCKRYPVIAGLSTAFVCSLILGSGASTYYAIAADRRAKEALKQYARAETNYEMAQENFARAEHNFQKAQAAVDQFFVQVSENTLLNQPGMQPLQHALLKQALKYYQGFLEERGDDPELQDEWALTHFRVGRITETVVSAEQAIPSFQKARAVQEALIEEHPDDPERLQALGNTLTALGRVVFRAKSSDQSEEIFQRAVAVREQLVSLAPRDEDVERELANSYMNLGLIERERSQQAQNTKQKQSALQQAKAHYIKAQELRHELLANVDLSPESLRKVHRDLGQGAYNLGVVLAEMGQVPLSLERFLEATQQLEHALEHDPNDQETILKLAQCDRLLARGAAQPKEAWEFCKKAESHLEPLVRGNPRIEDYQRELIRLRREMANYARALNRPHDVLAMAQEASPLIEKLLDRHPDENRLMLVALATYRDIAEMAGMNSATKVPFTSIQQLAKRIAQLPFEDRPLSVDLALALVELGQPLHRLGQEELALQLAFQGVSMTRQLVENNRKHLNHQYNHHHALGQLAQLLALAKKHAAARENYLELHSGLVQLLDKIPANPQSAFERGLLQFETGKTKNALAKISLQQKSWKQAFGELADAETIFHRLIAQFPNDKAVFQSELDQTLQMLAWIKTRPATAEKPTGGSHK